MIWSYIEDKNVWELKENDDTVSRIFVKDKDGQKNKFTTKVLIASIYTKSKTFNKLTKSKKNWKSKNRKFSTEDERASYIEIKKADIIKYLVNFH